MKLFRVLFMLITVSVFSTSIGATIPDWRKSSKNVVDEVRQRNVATLAIIRPTAKVVLIIGTPAFGVSALESDMFGMVSERVERFRVESILLPDLIYVSETAQTAKPDYKYHSSELSRMAKNYAGYRFPRDGIRYGSKTYLV